MPQLPAAALLATPRVLNALPGITGPRLPVWKVKSKRSVVAACERPPEDDLHQFAGFWGPRRVPALLAYTLNKAASSQGTTADFAHIMIPGPISVVTNGQK